MTIEIKSSGGSGSPVNGVIPLSSKQVMKELGGGTYLRSGYYETDVTSYPDASETPVEIKKPDPSELFYVGETDDSGYSDIAWGNGFYWVIGNTDNVRKFDIDGNFTGDTFDVSGTGNGNNSIAHDGTHFWVFNTNSDIVYKYQEDGTYTGTTINPTTQDAAASVITFDGTYIVVYGQNGDDLHRYDVSTGAFVDTINNVTNGMDSMTFDGANYWVLIDEKIRRYDGSGVIHPVIIDLSSIAYSIYTATGIAFDGQDISVLSARGQVIKIDINGNIKAQTRFVGIAEYPRDITFDGTHYWVIHRNVAIQYDSNKKATGVYFSTTSEDTNTQCITFDGTHLWIGGATTDAIYKYDLTGIYTGISFSVKSETAAPIAIEWDGSSFWVAGNNDTVFQYDSGGVYTGNSVNTASDIAAIYGIAWDGVYFYAPYNLKLYKFDSSWNFIEFIPTEHDFNTAAGICWDGQHLHISNRNSWTNDICRYNTDGAYEPYAPFKVMAFAGSAMTGCTYANGVYWVINQNETVYKFFSDGSIGDSIQLSNLGASNEDLTWDGRHFWVIDESGGDYVRQYDSDWNFIGTKDISAQTTFPKCLTSDGESIFLSDTNGLYKYDLNMSFIEEIFVNVLVEGYSDTHGIAFDGNNLWVFRQRYNSYYSTIAYIFDTNLNYTGISSEFGGRIQNAEWDGNSFINITSIYNITRVGTNNGVGLLASSTDSDTGLPIYIRIK